MRGPIAAALLAVVRVGAPPSPYFADQTRLYAQERWLSLRFTERAIRNDPAYTRERVTGRR